MEAKAEEDKAADIQQRLEDLKRATQVDAEDAKRIGELSLEIGREEKGLAELRSQTQGLEAQAAALQVKIDNAELRSQRHGQETQAAALSVEINNARPGGTADSAVDQDQQYW
eukprot:1161635-Pelagomonas_calceolata.AAC.20